MKKSVSKKVAFTIVFMLIIVITTSVFATPDFKDVTAQRPDEGNVADTATNVIKTILFVVQAVGMVAAVVMLIVVATKYIAAAPGEKATLKKQAVVYVVGAVLLFAASGIIQIIKTYALGLND